MKYVQVIEEAFSSQKRPSNTSKHELLPIFFYFCGSFLPSWIRIRIPSTDPDPQTRLNMDPIRIRFRILIHSTASTCVSGFGLTRFALRFLVGFLVSCRSCRLSFVRFPWTMPWLSSVVFWKSHVCFISGTGRGRGRGRGRGEAGGMSRERQKIMKRREERRQEDIRSGPWRPVLGIRFRMFLGLPDPDPDPSLFWNNRILTQNFSKKFKF